jgi:phosphatidylserine/phosphatidylglycerophosphate/cardiolipin synthase-like enzyme
MKILLIFLFLSQLSFGNSFDPDLGQKLEKIENLGAELSRDYDYSLDLKRGKISLSQKVELKNCKVLVETFNDSGVIQRDTYDLSKKNPNRKLVPFKGSFVLDFGLGSVLGERSFLHFDSPEERDHAHKAFSEYAKLCRDKKVKNHLKISNESIQSTQQTNYIEDIPEGLSEAEGKVYLEEDGNYMTLLRASDSFKARYRAVKNAQKTIYLSQLFYRGDPTGIALGNLLIQKRMEGKDVRVMVSGLFNVISNFDLKVDLDNSAILMRNMMAAGIRVHGFSCKSWLPNAIRGLNIGKILKPSHVKNWIIDGENYDPSSSVSISGGMNISSRYFRMGKRLQWFDQDVGVKGSMVEEMHRGFLRDYYEREIHYNTFKDDELCLNPHNPITNRKEYLEFKNLRTLPYKEPSTEEEIKEWGIIKENIELVLKDSTPMEWVKVSASRYVMGRPDEKENFLLKTHVDMVNSAQEEILIANVFSLFVPEMKLALRRAAARGVKIQILTNEPFTNKGIPMVNVLGRYYYRDLVYANHSDLDKQLDPTLEFQSSQVEIFEWVGPKNDREEAVMHSKFMVIDRKVAEIGSFNMDYASLKNPEQMVIFNSPELASKLAQDFNEDKSFAKKLTLAEIDSFKGQKGSKMLLFLAKMLRTRL